MLNNTNKKGFMLAFSTAALWGIYAVLMKVGVVNFENLHPFAFVVQAYLVGALALLICSGPGSLSKSTLQNISTWSYGVFNLLNNAFLMGAFCYAISATSATLLLRMGILLSILIDLVFVKNYSLRNKKIYLGLLFGLLVVAYGLDLENGRMAISLVFLSALMQVIQVKIAEKHKQNNQATGSIRSELRVTGVVTAVSGLIHMVFIGFLMFLNMDLEIVPTLEQILDLNSLIYATFVGLMVVSLNKYLILTSTKAVGSTNFLTIVAFTPLFTIVFEHVFVMFGLLDSPIFSLYELTGGTLIISSVMLITSRTVKGIKLSPKEKQKLKEAKEIILYFEQHFENNLKSIMASLSISKIEYKGIKQQNDYVVTDELLNRIRLNFNKTVISSDSE